MHSVSKMLLFANTQTGRTLLCWNAVPNLREAFDRYPLSKILSPCSDLQCAINFHYIQLPSSSSLSYCSKRVTVKHLLQMSHSVMEGMTWLMWHDMRKAACVRPYRRYIEPQACKLLEIASPWLGGVVGDKNKLLSLYISIYPFIVAHMCQSSSCQHSPCATLFE